jgi:hypothetical protein
MISLKTPKNEELRPGHLQKRACDERAVAADVSPLYLFRLLEIEWKNDPTHLGCYAANEVEEVLHLGITWGYQQSARFNPPAAKTSNVRQRLCSLGLCGARLPTSRRGRLQRPGPLAPSASSNCVRFKLQTAHSAHRSFACSKTVCVAFSCLSGG